MRETELERETQTLSETLKLNEWNKRERDSRSGCDQMLFIVVAKAQLLLYLDTLHWIKLFDIFLPLVLLVCGFFCHSRCYQIICTPYLCAKAPLNEREKKLAMYERRISKRREIWIAGESTRRGKKKYSRGKHFSNIQQEIAGKNCKWRFVEYIGEKAFGLVCCVLLSHTLHMPSPIPFYVAVSWCFRFAGDLLSCMRSIYICRWWAAWLKLETFYFHFCSGSDIEMLFSVRFVERLQNTNRKSVPCNVTTYWRTFNWFTFSE